MQNLTQIHPVTVCECSVWSVCVSMCVYVCGGGLGGQSVPHICFL